MQKIKIIIAIACTVTTTVSMAQQEKKGVLRFDAEKNQILTTNEETETDTVGYFDFMDVDMDVEESVSYIESSSCIEFAYFPWMPGYGRYSNFDAGKMHYKHSVPMRADTLVLGQYRHPADYPVTSRYGVRHSRMHYGFDLGYPHGTPVVAAFDGIVRISKSTTSGYGELVVIRHNNKIETYYAHLSQRLVNPGQMVKAGDTIALGGSTGRSTGNHLHFETRYLGIPFSPDKIINFEKYSLRVDTLYISPNLETIAPIVKAETPHAKPKPTVSRITTLNPMASKDSRATASTKDSQSPPIKGNYIYYRVKSGDTLLHIAQQYNTTVTKIRSINNLRSDFLSTGQNLRVK